MSKIIIENRIKKYRKMLKATQKELAGQKLSRTFINLLENNKVKLNIKTANILVNTLNNIALDEGMILNLSVKDLLEPVENEVREILTKKLNSLIDYDEELLKDILSNSIFYNLKDVAAVAAYKIGDYYYKCNNYCSAITYLEEAVNNANNTQKLNILPEISNRIGTCYFKQGDIDKAIDKLNQAYEEFKEIKLDNTNLHYTILYNLALAFNKIEKFEKALYYLDLILELKNIDNEFLCKGKLLKANIICKKKDNH